MDSSWWDKEFGSLLIRLHRLRCCLFLTTAQVEGCGLAAENSLTFSGFQAWSPALSGQGKLAGISCRRVDCLLLGCVEACLLCVLCCCWLQGALQPVATQVPTYCTSSTLCVPQDFGWSPNVSESRWSKHWVLHWLGENWGTQALYLLLMLIGVFHSSPPCGEEAMEVLWFRGSGVRALSALRPCPAVHLSVVGKMLWISRDLEGLRSPQNKHRLGCTSWEWASVLSSPVQQFTFLCGLRGVCGYHVILRLWDECSDPPSSQHMEDRHWRLTTMPDKGSVLCFSIYPQVMGLLLARVGGTSDCHFPCCQSSSCLIFSEGAWHPPSPWPPLVHLPSPSNTSAGFPRWPELWPFLLYKPPEYLSLKQ
jgi:hypothetical protein